MKALKFISISLVFCLGCNPDKVDTKAVKEELKNQKIQKISEGEIMGHAEKKGVSIVKSLQENISQNLNKALAKGNIEEAMNYCILNNNPLVDSLKKNHKITVTRTNFPEMLRNNKNAPNAGQKQILDAYSYNLEKKLPLFNDIQMKKEEIVFTSPIIINEKMCLQCHGTPGQELSDKDYKKILLRYPSDKSINYKMNTFMGLWTVSFNKQEFIKSME